MRIFKALLVVFLLLFSLVFLKGGVSAQACDGLSDVYARIDCYEKELGRLSAQSKTLSNQIAQFDAQIRLTTLKISQTEEKIVLLGGRIDQLEASLDALSNAFSSRAVETYKMARVGDAFLILISAPDLTGAVSRFHYLQKIQEADRDLLSRLQAAQTTYQGEKTDQETLQAELEKQKANLDRQKKDKANLLAITKNDEKRYQTLLAQALAEQGAIKRAISQALELLKNGGGEPVSAGTTIALIGNSGAPDCSSGSHLHFTILENDSVLDPAGKLKNIPVIWNNEPDGPFNFTGDWDWPISSPRITQGFGMTYYARLGWYRGNIHDGIDMTSGDLAIRAPKPGRIVRGTTTCDSPSVAGVSQLKYVAIGHDNGVITVYLHVQ